MTSLGARYPGWNRRRVTACSPCAPIVLAVGLLHLPAGATTPVCKPPEGSKTLPWTEVAAAAGAQYSGDGLAVTPAADGARLRCAFQRMEGDATSEGLWLNSTPNHEENGRFRVTAMAVGRSGSPLHAEGGGYGMPGSSVNRRLPATGHVTVDGKTVRFSRPGLLEEYSVSTDGVRQGFVVLEQPLPNAEPSTPNRSELRLELAVTGARAEQTAQGAQLVLQKSGRRIAYSRLKVTDAAGTELPARIEVASRSGVQDGRSALAMAILVDDTHASYPVRIDPTFSDANWISMGGITGTDGWVVAAVADASGNLYIGGYFTVAGDVVANRIARWDGNEWSALGSGMNDGVDALVMSGGDLYAGGRFTMAGGVAAKYVARWNGSKWSPLGAGVDSAVTALTASGNTLYAGGTFTAAGGISANHIAKWDGSSWSALGLGISGGVHALAVSGNDLYAGGGFSTAGGIAANSIAKWNGSSWSTLGSGMSGQVWVLAVSGSDLYAGGEFTTAGGIPATNIAKWNGSSWSALGSGINDRVRALGVSGGDLYAGGNFMSAGGISVTRIAHWNGSSWNALGSGVNDSVRGLAVSGGDLYAVGEFNTQYFGSAANHVARWDGGNWSPLNPEANRSGINLAVSALAVSGSDLYAGGYFTAAGEVPANHIAQWDGSSWKPLGFGINGLVSALAVSGGDLYAGGSFTSAGGVAATNIAKWNGKAWSVLGSGVAWPNSPNFPGPRPGVWALAVSSSNLYVGGFFTMAGEVSTANIAKWDGSRWSPLGFGVGESSYPSGVYALAVMGSDLYAGGQFTTASGTPAANIAKWDGSVWSALGGGVLGRGVGDYWFDTVYALAVSGSDLYVAGHFATAGGKPATNIAKWDGSSWSSVGSGLGVAGGWHDPSVHALVVSGGDVFAGGDFTTVGGIPAPGIAKWNGSSWSVLGSGVNGGVSVLAVLGADLYAGGHFTMAGGKVSAYLSKAIIRPPVLALERAASGANAIRFSGVPGSAYHLQRAPNPSGAWSSIATNIAPANGRIEVGDGSAPSGQGFYRVVGP